MSALTPQALRDMQGIDAQPTVDAMVARIEEHIAHIARTTDRRYAVLNEFFPPPPHPDRWAFLKAVQVLGKRGFKIGGGYNGPRRDDTYMIYW